MFLLVILALCSAEKRLQVENGTFTIMLFCDLHYGEDAKTDVLSSKFQRTMLQMEKPDLVVIDGDAMSNYAAPKCDDGVQAFACLDFFITNWQNFTAPIVEAKIPYVYNLGNHDRIHFANGSTVIPGHYIMQYDHQRAAMSYSKDGPDDIHGASNYVVPIYDNDTVVFYVWILDSNEVNCEGVNGWGCVMPDQVQWFRDKARELEKAAGKAIPGILFHHIPMVEVLDAYNTPNVTINGSKAEDVCCSSMNTGLFSAIKEAGNIEAVFHGHDHNNDFVAMYEDVLIGFGRKSGHGGYGGPVADKPGARIIQLSVENGTVSWTTHVRLESGAVEYGDEPARSHVVQQICCGKDSGVTDVVSRCRFLDDSESCLQAARRIL